MDAIERLKWTLHTVTESGLATLDFGDFSGLEAEMALLTAFARSGNGLELLDDDEIAAAVRAFVGSGALETISQARLVCYGCTRVLDGTKLIESAPRFAALLEFVDRYHLSSPAFRRCYRALLDAYFHYDADDPRASDEGRQDWRALRAFLERRKSWLETPRSNPAWVSALLDNRNLLTPTPVARYGMATLGGNAAAFEAVRAQLAITDESWVLRRLVLAQVDAAVELPDARFGSVVVRLLVAFAKYPQVRDAGLRKVIDRYAASSSPQLHARLRDYAVTQWGNPASPLNAPRWSAVRPASRELIASWMKAEATGE